MKKIKKAIIPAAGLGTRFLPATKTVPKEMLTIVDAPIIAYVVAEAVEAGIEDIVIVAGRGKHAIEDFFDTSYELEDKLAKSGNFKMLERLEKIRSMANIISIRQKTPMGLGHAVLCAEPIIGKDPFAVLLGDEIMVSNSGARSVTAELAQNFSETGLSSIAVMQVEKSEVSKYGIADVSELKTENGITKFKVNSLVEKPSPEKSPSNWALPGRYVLSGKIFDYLKEAKPSVNSEIQLTDSIDRLAKTEGLQALTFLADRFDAGDKFGYLKANVEVALKNNELSSQMKKYIIDLAQKLQKES